MKNMNKKEFINLIPSAIDHKSWGFSDLEIIYDTKDNKGACYRNNENLASYGSYGKSWEEVYLKMRKLLIDNGHVKEG